MRKSIYFLLSTIAFIFSTSVFATELSTIKFSPEHSIISGLTDVTIFENSVNTDYVVIESFDLVKLDKVKRKPDKVISFNYITPKILNNAKMQNSNFDRVTV